MDTTAEGVPGTAPGGTAGARRPRGRSGNAIIGPRDVALLTDVYLLRALSRRQLQALHFGSVSRCNARLHQLVEAGCLVRAYPPAASPNGQALYLLGKAGVTLVADHLIRQGWDLDAEAVRRSARRGLPLFLQHALAVGDLYVALHAALNKQTIWRLERFVPEELCRHEYQFRPAGEGPEGSERTWRTEAFKPDGFLRLTRQDGAGSRCFFLEADLGHSAAPQFAGKIRTHRRYLEGGLFRETYGDDRFHTLVVVPSLRRLQNLTALAARVDAGLFLFTTFDLVRQEGLLGRIWQVPGAEPSRSFLETEEGA